jgi:hypothetical protein
MFLVEFMVLLVLEELLPQLVVVVEELLSQ